jgi:Domain of unknown function (DUF4258)
MTPGAVVPFEDPRNYRRVLNRVRKLWDGGYVTFREHAEKQMARQDVDRLDVQHVIRYGSIIEHNKPKGAWRWTIQGGTVEDETMSVVVEMDGSVLIIVTVIVPGRR